MTAVAERRFFHSRWLLLTGVLTLTALPFDSSRMSAVVDAKVEAAGGKPDPCDQLIGVPGKAKGLENRCEPFGGGSGVAKADFNLDGFADLAVGIPYEDVSNETNAGAVQVLYGSATGLTATGNQLLTQNSSGVPDVAEAGDHFGRTVVAIDLNHDAFSDLVVGAPEENNGQGLLQVFTGSPTGLVPGTSFTLFSLLNTTCIECTFGSALAWGLFDGDNSPDLAIGMSGYSSPTTSGSTGAVLMLYGNGAVQLLKYAPLQSGSGFGSVMAAGDRNGDGRTDLAIGAPGYDGYPCNSGCGQVDASGLVVVFNGGTNGMTFSTTYQQSDAGGTVESGDQFGRAVALGDLDLDGKDELIVGTPFEDVGAMDDAGAVSIIYATQYPPIKVNETLTQDNVTGGNGAAQNDWFGRAVTSNDFDGDGIDDLAIGAPGEDFGNPNFFATFFQDAGIVHVMYGKSGVGVPSGRSEAWHQDTSGVPGANETGDRFGYALTSWNFGNGSERDLVIGIPYEDVNSVKDAGAIVVLYGRHSSPGIGGGLATTGAQLLHQGTTGMAGSPDPDDRWGSALY